MISAAAAAHREEMEEIKNRAKKLAYFAIHCTRNIIVLYLYRRIGTIIYVRTRHHALAIIIIIIIIYYIVRRSRSRSLACMWIASIIYKRAGACVRALRLAMTKMWTNNGARRRRKHRFFLPQFFTARDGSVVGGMTDWHDDDDRVMEAPPDRLRPSSPAIIYIILYTYIHPCYILFYFRIIIIYFMRMYKVLQLLARCSSPQNQPTR